MMDLRHLAIAMATLALAAGCAKPATPTASAPDTAADEAAIAAINPAWFKAYNEGDADRIAALYAEDAVFNAPALRALRGREAIRAYLAQDIAGSMAAGLAFVPAATTEHGLSGDLGWEWGTFSLTDKSGATVDTGKYVTVYQRLGGKWLIIRDIFNTDTPPPAAGPAPASAVAPSPAPEVAAPAPVSPTAVSASDVAVLESGAPPALSPTGESPTG
jgi:uncharacterized protein (TIGR02246 family)